MNLIKILTLLILFLTSAVGAQQTAPNTQVPTNVAPVNPANPINNLQQPNQQTAPKKERTEQILIDPFSGSASTASIDVNTNPDLANFVDQTLVGVIVGEKKRIAVLQSAQGQINRFKRNEKINSEYKILEIYKDKILVASLDNNEYEVYFNNVIKPVEKKRTAPKKPIKLEEQLDDTLDLKQDPLAPSLSLKKEAPIKKSGDPKVNTDKSKKENIKKNNVKKEKEKKEKEKKETIDDSYKPDYESKNIKEKEDTDLNKSEMEKLEEIDVEKIKEKLKKWN